MLIWEPKELENVIVRIITKKLADVLSEFIDQLYNEVTRRTRFSFQRWEKYFNFTGYEIIGGVRLPFEAPAGSPVPYTSNLYNNPYFKGRVKGDFHQPMQEALEALGVRCKPEKGYPIIPVPWEKGAPNLHIELNKDDIVKILRRGF